MKWLQPNADRRLIFRYRSVYRKQHGWLHYNPKPNTEHTSPSRRTLIPIMLSYQSVWRVHLLQPDRTKTINEGSPNACWFFSGNHDQVSLPNEFGPTLTDPYSSVRIHFDGGYVHAFGYWEINAALDTSTPITYQVVVHAIDGSDTVIPITSHYGANYVGIQSSVGIASLQPSNALA